MYASIIFSCLVFQTGAMPQETPVGLAETSDTAEGQDQLQHVDGDLQVPMPWGDGLELAIDVQLYQWGINESQQTDFIRSNNSLGYHRGEHWVFVWYLDFNDNPLVPTLGNVST